VGGLILQRFTGISLTLELASTLNLQIITRQNTEAACTIPINS
jgi:hypothetical protein